MVKKIILDCDPGHDDAVAILLAIGNPNIELLGVTTVGGNQSLEKVTYNARAVLEKAHAPNIPVHAGCARPIIRDPPALTAWNCRSRRVRSIPAMPSTGSSTRS